MDGAIGLPKQNADPPALRGAESRERSSRCRRPAIGTKVGLGEPRREDLRIVEISQGALEQGEMASRRRDGSVRRVEALEEVAQSLGRDARRVSLGCLADPADPGQGFGQVARLLSEQLAHDRGHGALRRRDVQVHVVTVVSQLGIEPGRGGRQLLEQPARQGTEGAPVLPVDLLADPPRRFRRPP